MDESSNAHDARDRYRAARDAQVAALSDRTRTMCLGGLVVIWGLFTMTESASFH